MVNLWCLVVCVWCDVLCRFVVVGKRISVDINSYGASACNTDTTQTQPHQISNAQRNKVCTISNSQQQCTLTMHQITNQLMKHTTHKRTQ